MINQYQSSSLFKPPVTHVAVADMDATYGAYVVAEHHTVNNTDNSDNDANGKHNHANPPRPCASRRVARLPCLLAY